MFDMNSGYDGYSMSKRASQAYCDGQMPLSKWRKSDILDACRRFTSEPGNEIHFNISLLNKLRVVELKDLLLTCSAWHHTSMYFNKTDFYEVDEDRLTELRDSDIQAILDKRGDTITVCGGIEVTQKIPENKSSVFRGAIHYVEWSGTRNHPNAKEVALENVNIEEKGCFYIVTNDEGKVILRKKVDSRGTFVVNYAEDERKKQKELERERRVREESSKEALAFFDSLNGHMEWSSSNHAYAKGRKPSSLDYDKGLDKFFFVGEHRLKRDFITGILSLETWNGSEWIPE